MLVTCYPIREKGESGKSFTKRVTGFLNTVTELAEQWQYYIKVLTALANEGKEGEIEFTEPQPLNTTALAGELRGAYAKAISPGQESQMGFVVRFDLEIGL